MADTRLETKKLARVDTPLPSGDLRSALTHIWGDAPGTFTGHAFDGVLWGMIANGRVTISHDQLGPPFPLLRRETLLDLCLFDEQKELRLWRNAATSELQACLIHEDTSGEHMDHSKDVDYVILGEPDGERSDDFVVLAGPAGERHAPPGMSGCSLLRVRHYYRCDTASGMLEATEHRVLGLLPRKEMPR